MERDEDINILNGEAEKCERVKTDSAALISLPRMCVCQLISGQPSGTTDLINQLTLTELFNKDKPQHTHTRACTHFTLQIRHKPIYPQGDLRLVCVHVVCVFVFAAQTD